MAQRSSFRLPIDPSRLPLKRAAAEFLVIFAGVTLGLAADAWREGQREAADGTRALALIYEDLAFDSLEIDDLRGPIDNHRESALWIEERWDEPRMDLEALGRRFRSYYYTNSPQLRSSAYAILREGGRLDIIRDRRLRGEIVRYYDQYHVRLNQYFTVHFEGREKVLRALDPHARVTSSAVHITSPWSALQVDNTLHNMSMEFGQYARLTLRYLDQAQEENARLRAAIVDVLGGPPEPTEPADSTGEP